MSGGHGHEDHGHGGHESSGNKWWMLTAFSYVTGPANQITSIFSGLLTGLLDFGGGWHSDHGHH